MRLTVFFSNGDSTTANMAVGTHLRDVYAGWDFCGSQAFFFNTRPTDTLSAELHANLLTSANFLDAQEIRLPAAKRNLRASRIRVSSVPLGRPCGGDTLWSGAYLAGLTTWSEFAIANRQGNEVARLRQDDPSWASDAYGGYFYQGDLVGSESTIGRLGCGLTCFAMANNFFGVTCTPATLNTWLQNNHGYDRIAMALVDSVGGTSVGSTIRLQWVGKIAPLVTRFVVEERAGTAQIPLAIVQVVSVSPTGIRASILQSFQPTWPASPGAYVRSNVNPDIATRAFSAAMGNKVFSFAGALQSRFASPSALAEAAEATMADSIPAFLFVNNGAHQVLGTGRAKRWTSAQRARGTYTIADPLSSSTALLPAYANSFTAVGIFRRVGPNNVPGPALVAAGASESRGLYVCVDVPGAVAISGPAGVVAFDSETGAYWSNNPEIIALRQLRMFDEVDQVDLVPPQDVFCIPNAPAGDYTVTALIDSAGRLGMTADAYSSDANAIGDAYGADVGGGQYVHLNVSYSPVGPVTISPVGTTGVLSGIRPAEFLGWPNPASGQVRFAWSQVAAAMVSLDIFDVAGRRVDGMAARSMGSGSNSWAWDCRDAGANRGLFFARLTVDGQVRVARIVVMRGR